MGTAAFILSACVDPGRRFPRREGGGVIWPDGVRWPLFPSWAAGGARSRCLWIVARRAARGPDFRADCCLKDVHWIGSLGRPVLVSVVLLLIRSNDLCIPMGV